MEHKLIQGGEQYLPFARSRLKAMRATGARYASQRHVFPDAEVNVQIVGQQSYIRLTGGAYNILSGVVKDGTVITGEPDVLRSFKPTEQCWKFPLKKREGTSTTAFHDEPILAINAHANVGVSGSQYTDLCASMYSGLMAKAVQVILGIGKQKPTDDGVQVKYDYRWARCHGIAVDPDGKSWLIEISEAEGVMAMRLPLIKGTAGLKSNPQKVLSETVKLFKGIPSGESFPVGAALTEAIEEGGVLRLLSAAGLADAYGKNEFSATLGWSFNDTGSEAHNTCYTSVSSVQTSFHYRIDITLGEEPGATLTEVSSGPLYGTARLKFYDAVSNSTALYPTTTWPGGTHTAPLFACHINGVLDVVEHYISGSSTTTTTNPGNLSISSFTGTYAFLGQDKYVHGDDPTRSGVLTLSMGSSDPFNFAWEESSGWVGGQTCVRCAQDPLAVPNTRAWRIEALAGYSWASYLGFEYPYTERKKIERTLRPGAAMMLRGTRDGYAYRKKSESQVDVRTSCYGHVSSIPTVATGLQDVGSPATSYTSNSSTGGGYPVIPGSATTRAITDGPWFDEIDIVMSGETKSVRVDYVSQAAADSAELNWSTTTGICDGRSSMFGSAKHSLYSAPVALNAFNAILSGAMLFSETNPATTRYSFVGYI